MAAYGISESGHALHSDVELRQLRIFEAVVRHGTVTSAAAVLDLAPSSVSEQIRNLESSLGVALFVRGPRGMRLSPEGERLLTWARRLLDLAAQAEHDVRGVRPTLRLGALETIAASLVPAVLNRLAVRRPDLDVEVHAERSREVLLDQVTAAELDAALVLDFGPELGDLGFPTPVGEPLAFLDVEPVPLRLVAAPTHSLATRSQLSPDDLAAERLLVNVPACSFWMAGERILGDQVKRVPAGGVPIMRAWAEQGLGISLLPEFAVADGLSAGSLAALDVPLPDLSLRLVWRKDRESLPDLRDTLYATALTTTSS